MTGVISDGTGSIDATFFNDAVVQLIGFSCDSLIESSPNLNMQCLPQIIQDSIGTKAQFHLQAHRNDRNGSTRCTINAITLLADDATKKLKQQSPSAPETPQKNLSLAMSTTIKRQLYTNHGNISTTKH